MVTVPIAQALGWITNDKTIRNYGLYGLKIQDSLNSIPDYGYEWCTLPLQSSITFPGTFVIPFNVSICRCKHRVVQVQSNLTEPCQVGENRLHLLDDMVPYGMLQETLIEEPEHIHYLPLRTKIFQTIDIYLTSACGQLLSFQGGIVSVALHFRRRTRSGADPGF